MQSIHSLPQQELLTGWSSMKGGREREMDRERKGGKNRGKERLTGSAPLLPSAIKEVRTQRGGGESVGPMLQAQLHVNPIIISHKYLNLHDVCCA